MSTTRIPVTAVITAWFAWAQPAAQAAAQAADVAAPASQWPMMAPARHVPNATGAALVAAARVGGRTVAVGDHGVILLSDDGTTFRQAKEVPVRSLLTAVQFTSERVGYAAGHDGVVLGTRDAGETWTLLRSTPGVEQPILALYFESAEHGIAVGLHGWAIETRDAGRTWSEMQIGSGEDADRHLFHLFASTHGTLLIAGEAGTVFRSTDHGQSWRARATGQRGSLWYGAALRDGVLLVCGMRGHLHRSTDDGKTWSRVESHTTQSLTGIVQLDDGTVFVVGMAGTVLRSADGGATFTLTQRAEQEPLTAVAAAGSQPLLFSVIGVVPAAGAATR
jgi:photosystem II stability/assembly factor-like uncharacterized protein